MMFGDFISSVHQIVGHDIEEVQRCADRRYSDLRDGQYISESPNTAAEMSFSRPRAERISESNNG